MRKTCFLAATAGGTCEKSLLSHHPVNRFGESLYIIVPGDHGHNMSCRYRNAGQTLHMMGFQNVANFSTQYQWLHVRATLDMNVTPMIRARSGIPAAHIACGLNV